MQLEVRHDVLVVGPDFDRSSHYARRFFARTPLVRYDTVEVVRERSFAATQPEFWPRVEAGILRNRQVLAELIGELKETGARSLDDLLVLPKGYQSKLVHTAAHLVDGFFGIDTVFYNMAEDSHGLTEALAREIRQTPADYWLLGIRAALQVKERETRFASLRRFETGG